MRRPDSHLIASVLALLLPIVTTRSGGLWVKEDSSPVIVVLEEPLPLGLTGPRGRDSRGHDREIPRRRIHSSAHAHQHQRATRDVGGGESAPDSVACNTAPSNGPRCLCQSDLCSVSHPQGSNAAPPPAAALYTTHLGVPMASSTPPLNCCAQVLSSADLLQVVTLRLEGLTSSDYSMFFEGKIRDAIVDNLRDYCASMTGDACGLTAAELSQTNELFQSERVFFVLVKELIDEKSVSNSELQVSFAVFLNELSSPSAPTTASATQPFSRTLSSDVLVAMIGAKADDIGWSLGATILEPTLKWQDTQTPLSSPTPKRYPFGMNFWQYFYFCLGIAIGVFIVFISFISAIKAVRDRKRIKQRIKERREQRERREKEEAEADQSWTGVGVKGEGGGNAAKGDLKPPTVQANGATTTGNDYNCTKNPAEMTSSSPNAHIVQVTVHEDVSEAAKTLPNNVSDNTRVDHSLVDIDSAVVSEKNSFACLDNGGGKHDKTNGAQCTEKGHAPAPPYPAVANQEQAPPPVPPRHDLQPPRETSSSVALSNNKNGDKTLEWLQGDNENGKLNQGEINSKDAAPPVTDLSNRAIDYVKQQSVDEDIVQAMSTPERKKAGILTPPKFFSPKKQIKGENLMLQSPSLDEKEIGLDNMAFDLPVGNNAVPNKI